MRSNIATTMSFTSAATCVAVAVLCSRLARGVDSRHFRYAALAALAGAGFCLGDATIAGEAGATATIWAGRASKVRVRATTEGGPDGWARIEVTDDGEGVPQRDVPRLFDPFFTTRASGTGLGLALVKRVAEAHGGTVTYEPPAEGGATFVLRLPAHPPRI